MGKRTTPTEEELKPLQGQLEDARHRYDETVFKIAQDAFERFVQPQCAKRGWVFIAGMGTWVIIQRNGQSLYPEDLRAKRGLSPVADLLELVAEGIGDLGTLMPDHTPRQVKKRRQTQ